MIFQQIKTILWEHGKIRKHHFVLTFLEVSLPIIIFVFVAYGRSNLPSFVKEYAPATYNDAVSDFTLSSTINVRDTKLLFTPYTDFTEKITREVQLKLNMYNEAIKGLDSKEDAMRYYRENPEGITVIVSFADVHQETPENLKYNLQIYEEGVDWQTRKLYRNDITYIPGAGSHQYLGNQFLAFQWALDTSFIEIVTDAPFNITMNFQEFPYPPHWTDNGMNDVFVHLLPLLTMLCFIFLFPSILKMIVEEKSSGMKQLMKINGLRSWAYWLGWFFNAYFLSCISAIVVAVLLTQKIFHEEYAPLQHVQFVQLAALLLLYCSATVAFIFSFSILFKNATFAMVIGTTAWFVSYIVYVAAAVNMEVLPAHVKYLASLLPHVALYYGFEIISAGELRGRSTGFSERPRNCNDDVTTQMILTMLFLDTILYLLVALFFETDRRGKYRISKVCEGAMKWSPKKSYETEKGARAERETLIDMDVNRHLIQEDVKNAPVLEIKELTKKYGDVTAIDHLNLTIYEEDLTVLLGHNGAGKTTILSIIAGLEQETSGELIVHNVDSANLKDRQLVSICPQENMLFPELSVQEHLEFFGKLKGLSAKQIREDVTDLLRNKLSLYEKRNEPVKNLSGGMKRKLSIGIAVMGKPKILILDEPTAGIDPEGRRDVWDVILSCKKNSSVIITTHLMEEAEELADRVAIVAHGSLTCYGTPMFLKEQYGIGYRLRLNCRDSTKISRIDSFCKDHINDDPRPKSIDGQPHVLEYRFEKKHQKRFSRLLSKIDDQKDELFIEDYKVSSVSLEDVFLKTLEKFYHPSYMPQAETKDVQKVTYVRSESITSQGSKKNENPPTGCFPTFSTKFLLILEKKLKFLRKSLLSWIIMNALFYLLVILTFVLSDSGYKDLSKDGKTLDLNLGTYGCSNVYFSLTEENSALQTVYENVVAKSSSLPHNTRDVPESIIERGIANIVEYRTKLIVASELSLQNSSGTINVMYSNQAVHGAPVSLNLINNVLLKYLTGKDYSIVASHTPLRSMNSAKRQTSMSVADNLLLWMILLPTGCLFSVIMFTALPTLERNTLMITLSRIYNLRSHCYWIINYIIDTLTYGIILLLPVATLLALSLLNLTIMRLDAVVILVGILFWYGVTIIPWTYVISFLAKSVSVAFAKFLIPNMSISPILTGILLSMEAADPNLAGGILWMCAIINPHVVLTYTLSIFCVKMIQNHNWDMKTPEQKQLICYDTPLPCCDPVSAECLSDRAYVQHPIYLGISFAAAILIIIIIVFVDREKDDKRRSCTDDDVVGVENLKKTYKVGLRRKLVKAVENLTFKVSKGECFGLLGVNGAGKSTSFRLITNQESPTEGKIFIGKEASIGYCPQDHAMIEDFTGRELLKYFGKLRNPDITDKEIDDLLEKCGLLEYRNRPCGTYSGGNKRKLNTCIGLIGDPDVIALDEPTTGVDPENRKRIRDLIADTKTKKESAIIFTSHSMDDCENLCDKLAIMKGGTIATGEDQTVENLKKKYNVGHVVQIKVQGEQQVDGVLRSLKQKFPNLTELEKRHCTLTVCVTSSRWRIILEELELMKATRKDIVDYTVKESSLEQVFLKIAAKT